MINEQEKMDLAFDRVESTHSYHAASDLRIWRDFLDGSKAAYAFMYENFFSSLYNYGYKFSQNREFIEDCIQDVFLHIIEHRQSLSETDSIKFYLFKALRNTIYKRLKKQESLERLETGEELDFKVEFSHQSTWLEARISQERTQHILHQLNQLPSRQKEVIFLRFYDNLSYAEIAKVMNIEQMSVYKVLYKAFANLQKRLSLSNFLLLLVIRHFFAK